MDLNSQTHNMRIYRCTPRRCLCGVIFLIIITMFHIIPESHDLKTSPKGIKIDDAADLKGFPRIIHQFWEDSSVPSLFLPWISSWMTRNPSWKYWFWTNSDAVRLLKPHPKLLELYSRSGNSSLDILKYVVIYKYGGIFIDIDYNSIKQLDFLIKEYTCFATEENHVHAYLVHRLQKPRLLADVMGCTGKHSFFRQIVEFLQHVAATGTHINNTTLTKLADDYNASYAIHPSRARFHRLPAHHFLSSFDPSLDMNAICSDVSSAQQIAVCEKLIVTHFENSPRYGSYGNHKWIYPEHYPPEAKLHFLDVFTFSRQARHPDISD